MASQTLSSPESGPLSPWRGFPEGYDKRRTEGKGKQGTVEGDQAIANTFIFLSYVEYIHLVAEIEGCQIKMEVDSVYAFYKNTVHQERLS